MFMKQVLFETGIMIMLLLRQGLKSICFKSIALQHFQYFFEKRMHFCSELYLTTVLQPWPLLYLFKILRSIFPARLKTKTSALSNGPKIVKSPATHKIVFSKRKF